MKAAALKSYGAKGQDVVDKNYAAIDRGGEYVRKRPNSGQGMVLRN